MSNSVAIIGGGISGLATAALLGKHGFQVTLFEKNSQLGGRASVIKDSGFLFDMGPSWYMMPEVFDQFFALFGKQAKDYFELVELDPRYRVYQEDTPPLLLEHDQEANYALFESIEKGAGERLKQFLAINSQVYERATKELMYEDFLTIRDLVKPSKVFDLFRIITKINPFMSWHSYVSSFFSNPRLQQILEFPSVFLGGNPHTTPALYSILVWADFGQKIWYPKGGMTKIVAALSTLCQQYKVEIKMGEPVEKILTQNQHVTQVFTSKGSYQSDVTVVSTDLAHSDHTLLSPENRLYSPHRWNTKKLSISALLLYLGLDSRIPNLTHHSLYFAKDWNHHFDAISSSPKVPENPSFYLSAPSVTDPLVAPKNKENLFILVPLGPFNQTISGTEEDKVIKHVSEVIGYPINDHIIVRQKLDPSGFAATFNAHKGTALGLSHTLSQSLFFRPKNRHPKLPNLFYTGQYTNPGVGVPMALASARMVVKRITEQYA